jgi:UPF0755 protein
VSAIRSVATVVLAVVVAGAAWLVAGRAPALVGGGGEVHGRGAAPVSDMITVITVAPGADGGTIARQLEREGVIGDAGLFRTLSGLMRLSNRLAAGEYEFTRGLPVTDVIQRLRIGVTVPAVTVTIPEGRRMEEVAALMERYGLVSAAAFMEAVNGGDYALPVVQERPGGATLEGYLFPDTYFFSRRATAREVVERLLRTFAERFDAELRAAVRAQGLTPHQAVTLASIVEREAQVAEERPLIAAVFLNRLRAGIPLQADPTVQYALASDADSVARYGWWKRELTVDDLKLVSPYSTYANAGLPPGPIASPGLASLRAVAHPAPVKYLYFVARGDGSHAFAETLEEHNRNVQRYQR